MCKLAIKLMTGYPKQWAHHIQNNTFTLHILIFSLSNTRRQTKCGTCFVVLLWRQTCTFSCAVFIDSTAPYRQNRSKLYFASIKYNKKHCRSDPNGDNILNAPFLVSKLCVCKTHTVIRLIMLCDNYWAENGPMTRCNHRCGTNANTAAKEPKTFGLWFFVYHLTSFTDKCSDMALFSLFIFSPFAHFPFVWWVCACGPFSAGHNVRLWQASYVPTKTENNRRDRTTAHVHRSVCGQQTAKWSILNA